MVLAALLVGAAFYVAFSLGPVAAQSTTDYDADDDGLIEVASLAQLNAMRWDLDGDGSASSGNGTSYSAAFPNAASGMGCPTAGCTGYELTADLDFDTNGDGRTDVAGDDYWNGGAGWELIAASPTQFSATFHGNGHSISNLYVNRDGPAALFGYSTGVVREVQL